MATLTGYADPNAISANSMAYWPDGSPRAIQGMEAYLPNDLLQQRMRLSPIYGRRAAEDYQAPPASFYNNQLAAQQEMTYRQTGNPYGYAPPEETVQPVTEVAPSTPTALPIYDTMRQNALDYAGSRSESLGYNNDLLNKYGVYDAYNNAVDSIYGGLDRTLANPQNPYNQSTMYNDALTSGRDAYRTDVRNDINSAAGSGFQNNLIGDTADDAYLGNVLSTQRNDVLSQLDAARDRGQISGSGYKNAYDSLFGDLSNTANTTLQGIGQGVLGGYRDQLTKTRDDELSAANSLDFNTNYDFGSFGNKLNTQASTLLGGMNTDLGTALGDKKFFDADAVIKQGGANSGAFNPTGAAGSTATGGGGTGDTNDTLLNVFLSGANKSKQQVF